jgi:hypothetical protein
MGSTDVSVYRDARKTVSFFRCFERTLEDFAVWLALFPSVGKRALLPPSVGLFPVSFCFFFSSLDTSGLDFFFSRATF